MRPANEIQPNRKLADLLQLVVWCGCLSLAIYGLFTIFQRPTWPSHWRQVVLSTLVVCNAATIPPKLLTFTGKSVFSGVTAALFTTVWRLGTFLVVIVLWTATKWLPSEFTAFTLVGCYFPFLILESGHSIKKANR